MHSFKEFKTEKIDRLNHLKNQFRLFLTNYTKLDKHQINMLVLAVGNANIPYYKLLQANIKDFNLPKITGHDKDIERLFYNALASANAMSR